jgi:hypothetical protein
MIKAKKGNRLILGLSDENLRRLKGGEPISFNLKEVGFDDIEVIIFNGKDEQTMQQELKDSINPYHTILKDSRAKNN